MNKDRHSKLYAFMVALAIFVMATTTAWADSKVSKSKASKPKASMVSKVFKVSKDCKNYGRIGIGANQPVEDLDDAGYDPGFSMAAAYGRYLVKYLILEAGINYFFTDQEFEGSTAVAGNYERDDYLSVSSLVITFKGELPLGVVRLFGGAGVGAYFASLNTEIETQNLGDFDADEQDSVFGAHVVAGGYCDITPRIFMGVEGLYRWTDAIDINETVGTIPVNYKGDLDGYAVMLTGGFRF